jgi:hypothetical protein
MRDPGRVRRALCFSSHSIGIQPMNRALLSHFSIGMLLLSSVLFVAFSVLVNMVTDAPRCSAESCNIIYTTVFAIRILQTIHIRRVRPAASKNGNQRWGESRRVI